MQTLHGNVTSNVCHAHCQSFAFKNKAHGLGGCLGLKILYMRSMEFLEAFTARTFWIGESQIMMVAAWREGEFCSGKAM